MNKIPFPPPTTEPTVKWTFTVSSRPTSLKSHFNSQGSFVTLNPKEVKVNP